ncbi:MAG: trimeric intracellular cation channel family protein [Candidatus Baltobacteraceae bacterium]
MTDLLDVLNLAGTFAFAISGATVAVQRRMDIFGVMVLAFITAVAGGVVRDLIIGAVPPVAFQSWHVLALTVGAALLAFFASRLVDRIHHAVLLFDAAGLGFFAVDGTQRALVHGIDPVMAGTLGLVTGIGGGIMRDLLSGRKPAVLSSGFYASAAIAAIVLILIAHYAGFAITGGIALAAVALCFLLRVLAIYGKWNLPSAPTGAQ